MHIKDNDNSPYDKSHRFLFPVSGKFPDLNFAPFRPICSLRDTNSEPGLPVVRAGAGSTWCKTAQNVPGHRPYCQCCSSTCGTCSSCVVPLVPVVPVVAVVAVVVPILAVVRVVPVVAVVAVVAL